MLSIFLVVLIVYGGITGAQKAAASAAQALAEARAAYDQGLANLRAEPTSAQRRSEALQLGRAYCELTRSGKGVTLYDEVAVMNDLNAAVGGATSLVKAEDAAGLRDLEVTATPSIESRLAVLMQLREKGLIDEVELKERKAEILREV
jgi:hypothetical protein